MGFKGLRGPMWEWEIRRPILGFVGPWGSEAIGVPVSAVSLLDNKARVLVHLGNGRLIIDALCLNGIWESPVREGDVIWVSGEMGFLHCYETWRIGDHCSHSLTAVTNFLGLWSEGWHEMCGSKIYQSYFHNLSTILKPCLHYLTVFFKLLIDGFCC